MSFVKKIACTIAVLVYGASLFTLAIPFATQDGLFVSPDEHATWTFAKEITQTGIAAVEEIRNESLQGLLHPRSAVTVGTFIVPAGFLGVPYVAGVLFMVSPYLAASMGPLFGLLGILALYHIVRKLGGTNEFAMLSGVALAIHPAWWYYSIRSLMPNVPFVSLLLCTVWLALVAQKVSRISHRLMAHAVTGMLFGVAVFIRPSEWLWIVGAIATGAMFIPSLRAYKKELGGVLLGFAIVAAVAFGLQQAVYGGALTTGYTVDIPAWEVGGTIIASDVSWLEKVFALLFPFGIHEKATLRNVWNYLIVVYPWMTMLAVWGVGYVVSDYGKTLVNDGKKKMAWMLGALSAAYVVVLYGSWTFFDNPDPAVISIGNSHVRYWLPLMVLCAPIIAYGLLRTKQTLLSWAQSERSQSLAKAFPVVALIFMVVFSAHIVFAGNDGVLHTREALATFEEKRSRIVAVTPEDAIVIVDRADKYLWPDRAVVVPLRSDKTYTSIPALLKAAPLYYFGITLPEEDLAHLNNVIFAESGITFAAVLTVQEETLYVISQK